MTYKEKIKITQEELNYYNELLQLDLEENLPYYNKHDINLIVWFLRKFNLIK